MNLLLKSLFLGTCLTSMLMATPSVDDLGFSKKAYRLQTTQIKPLVKVKKKSILRSKKVKKLKTKKRSLKDNNPSILDLTKKGNKYFRDLLEYDFMIGEYSSTGHYSLKDNLFGIVQGFGNRKVSDLIDKFIFLKNTKANLLAKALNSLFENNIMTENSQLSPYNSSKLISRINNAKISEDGFKKLIHSDGEDKKALAYKGLNYLLVNPSPIQKNSSKSQKAFYYSATSERLSARDANRLINMVTYITDWSDLTDHVKDLLTLMAGSRDGSDLNLRVTKLEQTINNLYLIINNNSLNLTSDQKTILNILLKTPDPQEYTKYYQLRVNGLGEHSGENPKGETAWAEILVS